MMRSALAGIFLIAGMGTAMAQPMVAPELVQRTLRAGENRLSFCIGAEAYLHDFEVELANAIASALLLEPVIFEYPPLNSLRPYDYTIGHEFEDVYLLLTNDCDVFMGMTLAGDPVGNWLDFSQPIYETRFVLVAQEGEAPASLGAAGHNMSVGTRLGSDGDLRLLTFLQSLPEAQRPRRFPFNDNRVLARNLIEGNVDMALIWEPAIRGIAEEFGDAWDVEQVDMAPFQTPVLPFGVAYLRGNSFVREIVDQAIVSLESQGVIDTLVEDYLL